MEKRKITIVVSQQDYETIRNNAAKRKQTLTAYVKDVALDSFIINYNYDAILNHLNEIADIKREYMPVINTILMTGIAYPKDIETLISSLKTIEKSLDKLWESNKNERLKMRKYIKSVLENRL